MPSIPTVFAGKFTDSKKHFLDLIAEALQSAGFSVSEDYAEDGSTTIFIFDSEGEIAREYTIPVNAILRLRYFPPLGENLTLEAVLEYVDSRVQNVLDYPEPELAKD